MARKAWTVLALLALAVLPAASVRAPGPTHVGGIVTGSVTWSAEGSPYIVTENVTIADGATLTIEPGVEVRFNEGLHLRAFGSLVAVGTEAAPIRFGANNTFAVAGFWDGLMLGAGSATVENVSFESAEVALSVNGGTQAAKGVFVGHSNTGLRVENGAFQGTQVVVLGSNRTAAVALSATVVLDGSLLGDNVRGFASTSSTITLLDSVVSGSVIEEFNLTDSSATLLNTSREGTLVFDDAVSTLVERQRLAIRVVDVFSAPVQEASVGVRDNVGALVDTRTTDTDGGVGVLELTVVRRNATGSLSLVPYSIEASKDGHSGSALANLAAFETVTVGLAGDLVEPVAVAPASWSVDEDVVAALDGSPSYDNDPTFDASGNFTWTFPDGTKAVTLFGRVVSYAWETPGTYEVRFRVRDAAGHIDDDYTWVVVRDRTPPQVSIGATAYVAAGHETTLTALATDNDPAFPLGAGYRWVIAGPVSAALEGAEVRFAYPEPGRYTVTLAVTDAGGNGNTAAKTVEVAPATLPWPGIEGPAVSLPGLGDVSLPFLLMATLAAFVGAWFGGTDRGQASLLFSLFLPLYTRLRKEDALDQFTRGQIFGYIRVHPGDSFTDIKRNLQLENGVLAYHLGVLEKGGLVRARAKGSRKLYFPVEAAPVEDGGLHDLQHRMLEVLTQTPGLTVRELSTALGVSRQLATYHLRALAIRGLASVDRQGFKMRCFPTGPPTGPA